jgi:hypothetical protein
MMTSLTVCVLQNLTNVIVVKSVRLPRIGTSTRALEKERLCEQLW